MQKPAQSMLPKGTLLQGKYRIESFLASGGFGNTYYAIHTALQKPVAIKEFFMRGINGRERDTLTVLVSNNANQALFDEQRIKFQKEARRISRLNNPHIVHVSDLFAENGTCYYVMEYIDGESLSVKMKNRNGPFSDPEIVNVLNQMLDALSSIHEHGIWHMDIKPGNILMDRQGKCTLIDFGSSKQSSMGDGATTSTSMSYTQGYAPSEQINGLQNKWGPWTDFYALGATLYNLLTMERPPLFDDILENEGQAFHYPRQVSQGIRDLIQWMMNPMVTYRPQSVEGIRKFISTNLQESEVESKDSSHGHSQDGTDSGIAYDDTLVERGGTVEPSDTEYSNVPKNPSEEETAVEGPNPEPPKSKSRKFIWILSAAAIVALAIIFGTSLFSTYVTTEPPVMETETKEAEQTAAGQSMSNDNPTRQNKTFTVNGVSFTMVYVHGGTFTMGATSEQGGDASSDEKPAHVVTLGSYMIGQTEVTQALWEAVMGGNPSYFKGANRPVETVSWDDCHEFLRKLNALTGERFRLPTEAEWEYAARGGDKSKGYKYSGGNDIKEVAWYWQNSGDSFLQGTDDDWDWDKIEANNCTTHPVGTKHPNELGIYDMSGNVWEWCQDWYGSYSSGSQTDPQGPSSGSLRVDRGGSWFDNAWYCRVSCRNCSAPDFRFNFLGFRLGL